MREEAHDTEPALERFVFFSDAVFAIAITLLALEIKTPVLPARASEADWVAALTALTPSFFAFGLSFFVIGSVWTAHHAVFRIVGRFDQRMMTPNLLLLAAVVMTPFASSLLGRSISVAAPYVFYSGTLLVAGVAKAWLTVVATRPVMLRPDTPARAAMVARRRSWLMPAAAGLALGLAFVAPGWNNLAMMILTFGRLPLFKTGR